MFNLIFGIMVEKFSISSNYDFSRKRVRYCGAVMDKFDICYHIDHINPDYVAVHCLYNVCNYSELVDILKSLLN